MRHLIAVRDLDGPLVDRLLERVHQLIRRRNLHDDAGVGPFVTGLVFTEPSLRTRAGFAVATARLGGSVVDVSELRHGPGMSQPEPLVDTIRVVTGMVDVAVVRSADLPKGQELLEVAACPVVNGGDASGNHPTQVIVDLVAMEEVGPIESLRVGVCGDVDGRVARSLLELLAFRPPASIRLMFPEELGPPSVELPPSPVQVCHRLDVRDLDVLYLCGLPATVRGTAVDAVRRATFSLGSEQLGLMAENCIVLSPMPVIDEIDPGLRGDRRITVFHQSDIGIPVRMAVLESSLGRL